MAKGKVFLVGAGPGDPGLFTLKGLRCLKEAEVIVYDRLVSPRLLKFAPEKAELIYVGKSSRKRILSQEKINQLLVNKAKQGKVVLRLKGGDVFLFGRGSEEAVFLAKHKIPFEAVPGVSSAIAVPAYAGIPLTDRRYTSSLGIFTGHEDPFKRQSAIDWEKISTGLGTLVFLMGVGNLSKIAGNLIKFGRPPTTPCCLVRWGTLPGQKTVTATLSTIAKRAKESGITPPAILIVGDVVRFRKDLNWFEEKPLFGKRILVTSHREGLDRLSSILEAWGASVVEMPLIKIVPLKDYRVFDSAVGRIHEFNWAVFSSQNGVGHFLKRINYLGKDLRILAGVKLAAIGPNTKKALEDFGLRVDAQAERYCQEGLLEYFKKRGVKGDSILIAGSAGARDALSRGLTRSGARVFVAPVYKTEPEKYKLKTLDELLRDIEVICFGSSSCVLNFFKIVPRRMLRRVIKSSLVASIGPVTSTEARRLGLKVDIQAKEYTKEALVEAIVRYFEKQ
ncbi:MAG: uroporphyrinogen-III C-methyltransferase [Candidatus Omnitrophota bacterium]